VRLPFRHTGKPIFTGIFLKSRNVRLTLCHFNVKRRPSQRTAKAPQTSTHKARSHSSTFAKVYGGRKQPFSQPLARLLLLRVSPVGPINYSPLAYTCTELRRFPSSPGKFRRGPQRYAPGQGNPRPVLRMRPGVRPSRAQQRSQTAWVGIISSRWAYCRLAAAADGRTPRAAMFCKQHGSGFSPRLPFHIAAAGDGRTPGGASSMGSDFHRACLFGLAAAGDAALRQVSGTHKRPYASRNRALLQGHSRAKPASLALHGLFSTYRRLLSSCSSPRI